MGVRMPPPTSRGNAPDSLGSNTLHNLQGQCWIQVISKHGASCKQKNLLTMSLFLYRVTHLSNSFVVDGVC